MTRGDLIWKWSAYSVVLALAAIVNFHVLNRLPLGAVPLLLQSVVLAVGVLEGPRSGAGFGIAAGLVQSAAAHGTLMWVWGLAVVGWVCGLVAQFVLRRDLVGYLLAVLVTGVLHGAGEVALQAARGVTQLLPLLRVAGLEYLWTVVFAFPIYWMCRFCCRHYGRIYHE